MSTENKTPETKPVRRKKSLFKAQIVTVIILGVLIAVMAVGVAFAVHYFSAKEVTVDEWSEINPITQKKDVYYCKSTGDGYTVTDAEGNPLVKTYVDVDGNEVKEGTEGATAVYETAIGSLLKLGEGGKITYFAAVDFGGKYTGGDTSFRLMIFPRIQQGDIDKIALHHVDEDGKTVEFTIEGYDSDKNGATDKFRVDGYERSTVSQLVAACIASYAGNTLSTKKLSTDYMEQYDKENGTNLIEDGQINYAEYGLDLERAAYYDITTLKGKTYRLYIGDMVPDGNGIYVRFYDETEGHRNAVYIIANDSGASALFGGNFSKLDLLLSTPEELVYPQITSVLSANSYSFVDKFTVSERTEEGYRDTISFSYIDLGERNFTINQVVPYKVHGFSELSGYIFNSERADTALGALQEISSIIGTDYTESSVKNYITVIELVKDIIPEKLSSNYDDYSDEIAAAVDSAVINDAELAAVLEKYGLVDPANKISFGSMGYINGELVPVNYNLFWISERTDRNTYYVWAPMYQQIVELSEKYLAVLGWDTFDWASSKVYETSIDYLDGLRIKGLHPDTKLPYDILFEVTSTYYLTFTTGYTYSIPTDDQGYPLAPGAVKGMPKFELEVKTTLDGKYYVLLSSNLEYNVEYQSGTSGTEKHIFYLAGGSNGGNKSYINLTTVKNYCKCMIDNNYFSTLSEEEANAVRTYANQSNAPKHILSPDGKSVTVTHTIADPGDAYGYIAGSTYIMQFIFDSTTDSISISAYQKNSPNALGNILFDETVMNNYVKYYMRNEGESGLSSAEIKAVKALYKTLSNKTSDQNYLTVTSFDESGAIIEKKTYENVIGDLEQEGTQYMTAFKNFYKTLLYASYQGRVSENDTVTGIVLSDEQTKEFRDRGDDCDVKIEINLGIGGISYTYRMYNYSATRTYITSNGEGEFYIDRDRANKFLVDAVKAMNGDMSINADKPY